MAKSRLAAALLFLCGGVVPAAATETVTAEDAITRQREQLREAIGLQCSREEREIVVCGRARADPNRAPFPDQRVEGERVRLAPYDAPSGRAGLAAGQSPCSTVGPNQRCGGGLPVFQTVALLAKIARHLIDPED